MSDLSPKLKKEMKRGRISESRFWEIMKDVGFRPHKKITTLKGNLLLAYTDREHDNPEYPAGYYQVAVGIVASASKGYVDGFTWVEYDGLHDLELTEEQRLQARINEAVRVGKEWVSKNAKVGRYA